MQLRCKNTACNKLLAVGSGDIQIKCPRCKQFQHPTSAGYLTRSKDAQPVRLPAKAFKRCPDALSTAST